MDDEGRRLLELKAEILQAAGHPIRLAIIEFLHGGEQCVCDIAEQVEAQRSNVSRHLGLLQKVGIVESRKDGLKVIYRLRTPCLMNFLGCVNDVLRDKMQAQVAVLETMKQQEQA